MLGPTCKSIVALCCCALLLVNLASCGGHRTTLPKARAVAASFEPLKPLEEDLKKPYLTLFETAPRLEYGAAEIARMQQYLEEAEDYCAGRFEGFSKQYQATVNESQKALKQPNVSTAERHGLHCSIQDARLLKSQADVIAKHAIPVAYDNKMAKLELIQKWPAELQAVQQSVADGTYKNRRWGDVQDIGFREVEPNQKDDIKTGQEAIKDLQRTGLMPKEVENEVVVQYVADLSAKLAANSDLQVPLRVTVLNSKEINAFALPGGYIFVERGLLEAVDDESQLAGVISHEMSHVVARHGHKLMKKATIAQLIYQAAQVATIVLTGGVGGIGTYYAIQYGFYGLGLTLSLTLLGVSRDYEEQADQLGIQYAWKAGYDPTGFIRFFDKMATREGYVNGASWFRSHPPFYQRMVNSEREIAYLPKKESAVMTTTEFQGMKDALKTVTAKAEKESKERPSLLSPEQGCAAPSKLVYEADQPIETICGSPQLRPNATAH